MAQAPVLQESSGEKPSIESPHSFKTVEEESDDVAYEVKGSVNL